MNIIVKARDEKGGVIYAHKDTIAKSLIDNADGLSEQDVKNIKATLKRGEIWHGGGGASRFHSHHRHRTPECRKIPA